VNLFGTFFVAFLLYSSFSLAQLNWSKGLDTFYLDKLAKVAEVKQSKAEEGKVVAVVPDSEPFSSKFTFNLASFFTIATFLLGYRMKRYFYVKYRLRNMPKVDFQYYGIRP